MFVNVGLALGAGRDLREQRRRPRRARRGAWPATERYAGARRRWRSRGRSRRSTGCRRRTRPSAGSGTSCSRICRRSSSPAADADARRSSTILLGSTDRRPRNTEAASAVSAACLKTSRSSRRSSRDSVVHLALRAAADPRLRLLHLGRVARRDARRTGAASDASRRQRPRHVARLRPRASRSSSSRSARSASVARPVPASRGCRSSRKIAGVLIIVFGLHTMGLLPHRPGSRTRSASRRSGSPPDRSAQCWSGSRSPSAGRRASVRSSAASWRSPASKDTVRQGVELLAVYSLGLGDSVPADVARDQPVLRRDQTHPQALPRDRARLGRAARRHRRR